MNQSPSAAPVPKMANAGATGAAVTLIIWLLRQYAGVEMPPEAAAGVATVLAFVVGYMTPPEGVK